MSSDNLQTSNRINVRFRHQGADLDYLRMAMRIRGEQTGKRRVCEATNMWGAPERMLLYPRQWSLPISSSWFCPFKRIIAWLESLASGDSKAETVWENEGDDVRLTYTGNRLLIQYYDRASRPECIRAEFVIERKHLVRAIYESFRRFVESEFYDPCRYERELRFGEALTLSLGNGITEDEIRGQLLFMNSMMAEFILRSFNFSFRLDKQSPLWDVPEIDDVKALFSRLLTPTQIERQVMFLAYDELPHRRAYIPKLWDRISISKRREMLKGNTE